jgi:hypothetical protein
VFHTQMDALILTEEARQEVERRILRGEIRCAARDAALAHLVPDWIRLYGKEAANVAVRAVLAMPWRDFLSNTGPQQERDRWRKYWQDRNVRLGRNDWFNRWFTRLAGMPLH